MSKNVLVTGSGGIGGVNFVNALRVAKREYSISGTDYNKYYLELPELNSRYRTPKHTDPKFLEKIKEIINEDEIDFLHPSPHSEASVIAKEIDSINTATYLPSYKVIIRDKLETQEILDKNQIPVAKTRKISSLNEIRSIIEGFNDERVWVRMKSGAGGKLSLLCETEEQIEDWIRIWVNRGIAEYSDFMIQEYLPGRNIACDSLWHNGKMIASFTRERLEYPFKHISPSGITGTPTVSRIIVDDQVNEISKKAILASDSNPNGSYAVDLKGDKKDNPTVTEIDSGKFHTTTALWGIVANKLGLDEKKNLADYYCAIGMNDVEPENLGSDIYPENLYLIRHIDTGTWIWKEDGYKVRIL
ncbi:MAG: hypothetical protein CMO19_01920 [Thaumarchaeota archaeon]|nr:hypothetical protein [Nitrososphaerota archaeon]|tara:strand:- start:1190 stop:2266 length:1077 start_codon:yes stop_codon:yes gene_type:complete